MTTLASAVLARVAVLLGGNLPWIAFLAPLNVTTERSGQVANHRRAHAAPDP
jgi:hypothetical protein